MKSKRRKPKRIRNKWARPETPHPIQALRTSQGITLAQVERASLLIAQRMKDPRWIIWKPRLNQIEIFGSYPGAHKMAALAEIYQVDVGIIEKMFPERAAPPMPQKAIEATP